MLILVDHLSEDESAPEEETAHHVAISTLHQIDDLQAFIGLPSAEQEHDQADEVGGDCSS